MHQLKMGRSQNFLHVSAPISSSVRAVGCAVSALLEGFFFCWIEIFGFAGFDRSF